MADDLYGIGLILGLAFFMALCVIRMFINIPPLNNRREKRVAGLLAALAFTAGLTVLGRIFELHALRVFGRASMMVTIWMFSFYVIHYWTLVATGKVKSDD